MRLCDAADVKYEAFAYSVEDGGIGGHEVAAKLGISEREIFKTLAALGRSGDVYIFVIPVRAELDLKKAAKAVQEKSVNMLPVKDLLAVTGYVKGGCSPLGLKKRYSVFFDESVLSLDLVMFNAGQVGLQMQVSVKDLERVLEYTCADLCSTIHE